MKIFIRVCLGLLAAALLLFLLTGLFDFLYVRAIVGAFQQGLEAINWVNPHLGKAIIALVSAILALIGFRLFAFSLASVRRGMEWVVIPPLFLAAITHGITAFATRGDIFDALGHSDLYYGIDDSNRVEYFNHSGRHPRTGVLLVAVTPENVREVELRRHVEPQEIKNPGPNDWFTTRTRKPKLWFVLREDDYYFFNLPGFDTATSAPLQPVTKEVKTTYEAAMQRREAERQQGRLSNSRK